MRKGLVIALAVLMVVGLTTAVMGMSDFQQLQFKVTVQKYIEVNPGVTPMVFSRTIPGQGTGVPTGYPQWAAHWIDPIYVNCPFTISYNGYNPAVDNLPILARLEIPIGNGYDRLQTRIHIKNNINGTKQNPGNDYERHDMDFRSHADGAPTGTWSTSGFCTGQTLTFAYTPHDGEVDVELFFDGTLPHQTPEFGVDNPWNQSADAGMYKCRLRVTYMAL